MYLQAQDLGQDVLTFVSYPKPVIALTHAKVIDGTGRPAAVDQTVLIENGRISEVGKSGDVKLPQGARIVDMAGKTVIPGLIMLHEHLYYTSMVNTGDFHINEMTWSFPRLYLAGGVTTLRTGGCVEPMTDLKLKKDIDEGISPGPKMHLTAPYLEGEGIWIKQLYPLKNAQEAAKMVDVWADMGFSSYKGYNYLTREMLRAAVEVAHRRDLHVTAHLCSITYREAAEAGIDNLEHGFAVMTDFVRDKKPDECPSFMAQSRSIVDLNVDSPEVEALMNLLIQKQVAITSTLPVFAASVPGEPVRAEMLEALAPFARENILRTYAAINSRPSEWQVMKFKKIMALEKKFFDMGGFLVAGTDPTGNGRTVAGFANQRQVELLVEAGFSPVQAIQVATLNGAKLLKIDGDTGSIEPGKLADLVIIDGDLEADIYSIRKMETVFKNGIGYDSQKLFDSVRGTVGVH